MINIDNNDTWISPQIAKNMLGVKQTSTLTKLAIKGLIKRTKANSKVIYYSKNSILNYLNGSSS
ncbi:MULTISPECIES: hypothetical protein [Campylobacter]|uniref:Uncharacterized protein n=1 Tax=Campylobacter porcelli TaxID=1660073 RepID=A0ABU7M4F2_9BACT|nr:hypothetical protein [Campylobacter sp. P0124]MCR8697164.1 hypothetical protein [Campylobacter sp. RM19073]MEE3704556.1 hypothetical protein [Campylobacter sp. CX2-8023-23]MEE3744581.1 hypothetical protein [Campylobacter sp. CX2-4855-23]MEE3776497.1 hypothetical protein [Campylobacter sp. CX2-4080-23]